MLSAVAKNMALTSGRRSGLDRPLRFRHGNLSICCEVANVADFAEENKLKSLQTIDFSSFSVIIE